MKQVEHTLGRPLSSQESAQIRQYISLLRQWNPKINLVAPSTLADAEARHVLDSAQLAPHLPAREGLEVLDVGSGAGLPGLILSILCPGHRFTLAERDQRKSAFIITVAHTLGLKNVKVHAADVKTLTNQFDIVTSRAWASLPDILELTSPMLKPNGAWLLLKGKALDAELEACETLFHLTTTRTPSIVSSNDGTSGWIIGLTRN